MLISTARVTGLVVNYINENLPIKMIQYVHIMLKNLIHTSESCFEAKYLMHIIFYVRKGIDIK